MVIAEINIIPVGTSSSSMSSFVSQSYRALERMSGIKYQLTPAATILEGDLDKVIDAIKTMEDAAFSQGISRVVANITIDDRRDKPITMEHAVEAVLNGVH